MSTYRLLVITISAKNKQYDSGKVTDDDYAAWKEETLKKMDMFLLCNRITDDQYKELSEMMR